MVIQAIPGIAVPGRFHDMCQKSGPLTLLARYVFPVTGDPIPDGSVTIEGGRIVAVGGGCAGASPVPQEVRDLGNVAILPGLVNAHAHLDFSDLAAPLGEPGIGFADWIRQAMDYRRRAVSTMQHRVALGLQECICCGVTTLGDIAQPGWPTKAVAGSPLNITVFQELIAPTAQRVAGALELARSHVRNNPAGAANWQPGLSPHSPYSVHPELLAAVIALSAAEKIPLATHLAESQEELELLRTGTGPLRTLLEEFGAWDAMAVRPTTRPMDYLRLLARAHRTLVIHGNYLDDEEMALLGTNAERMAVVYCPRSHAWFGRSPYPLEKMLAAGCVVALGTDGRGSSPDLSMLAELRFAARRHPAVSPAGILQMGTLLGAKALGRDKEIGSLEPGKRADLAIVALPNRDAADPHELLFDSAEPVVACYCGGQHVEIPAQQAPVGYASA